MINISKKDSDGIFRLINESNTICVAGHKSPDGDCIGSVTAMYMYLKELGKDVYTGFDGGIPYNLESFITPEMKLEDKEKKYDLLIMMDCADEFRLGNNMYLLEKADHIVCIDHHKTNANFAEYNIIVKDFSSTGELLYHFFKMKNININLDIAERIYLAMVMDTGGFSYSSTTSDTLRVAADLLEIGVNTSELDNLLFNSMPLKLFKAFNSLLSTANYYYSGQLGIIKISQAILEEYDLAYSDLDGLVGAIREVKEIEVSCVLKEKKAGGVKISLRSKTGKVDVAEICQMHGGGGHSRAAGADIDKSLNETEKILIEDLKNSFEK